MLRTVFQKSMMPALRLSPSSTQVRTILSIPTDKEQQTGRRKEEIEAEAAGQVAFNRNGIVPAANGGTRENPILVSSGYDCRVVGFENPATHCVAWFNLYKGKIHYVPEVNLFFKLDALH